MMDAVIESSSACTVAGLPEAGDHRPMQSSLGGISDDAAAGAINYQRAMRTDEALPGCKTAERINRNMPTETPRQQQTKTIYS
jgi:hypothetical protein